MAMHAMTAYASASGGEVTPGTELSSSMRGWPALLTKRNPPFQSSDKRDLGHPYTISET